MPEVYCRALLANLEKEYPSWTGLRRIADEIQLVLCEHDVSRLISDPESSRPPEMGYCGITLLHLIDREWLAVTDNEFERSLEFLLSGKAIHQSRKVAILGGGLGRLGNRLSALSEIDHVLCTDLSWEMVFFGKLLCSDQSRLLPDQLRTARQIFKVSEDRSAFISQELELPLARPLLNRTGTLDFAVVDAFSHVVQLNAELIVLPYLLDAFSPPNLETLLIRLSQQTHIGQEILLLVTAVPHRRPDRLLATLRQLGWEIGYLDLKEQMPYSCSRRDFAHRQENWNTMLIEAVKARPSAPSQIGLSSRISKAQVHNLANQGKQLMTCRGPGLLEEKQESWLAAGLDSRTAAECLEKLGILEVDREANTCFGFLTATGAVRMHLLRSG